MIEDVCEAHGTQFNNRKVGSFGWVSNFSFYYAHHMSTIEGGMVCTDNEEVYQICRMLRSHGMVREITNEQVKNSYHDENPELNPDFIFAFPLTQTRISNISYNGISSGAGSKDTRHLPSLEITVCEDSHPKHNMQRKIDKKLFTGPTSSSTKCCLPQTILII